MRSERVSNGRLLCSGNFGIVVRCYPWLTATLTIRMSSRSRHGWLTAPVWAEHGRRAASNELQNGLCDPRARAERWDYCWHRETREEDKPAEEPKGTNREGVEKISFVDRGCVGEMPVADLAVLARQENKPEVSGISCSTES